MANKPTTTDVATNAQYKASVLNDNFATLEDAIENGLGRGGTGETNNSMQGDLDMNNNRVQNVAEPTVDGDAANKGWVEQNYGVAAVAESEHWANYPVDSLVPEGDLVDDYSALHHATKAAASAAAAANSVNDKVSKTSATGAAVMPTGTTAERDSTPLEGYMRRNTDLQQFEGYTGTDWEPVGAGASGAAGNPVFYENDTNVTADYTITTGKNAMSAGPITVDAGVTVTVPTGSVWTIV